MYLGSLQFFIRVRGGVAKIFGACSQFYSQEILFRDAEDRNE